MRWAGLSTQMTTFAVGGLGPWPLTSVDPRGNEVVVARWHGAGSGWNEPAGKFALNSEAQSPIPARPPYRRGSEGLGHPRLDIKAIRLGRAVLTNADTTTPSRRSSKIQILASCCLAAKWWMSTAARRWGFLRGKATIAGFGATQDQITVDFQNEWIVAWREMKPSPRRRI